MILKINNQKTHVAVTLKLDKRLMAAGLVSGVGAFFYATYIERKWLEVTKHTLEVQNLPQSWNGFRFAWLSDLHLGYKPSADPVSTAFDRVIAEKPDLILLGGDYMDRGKWKPICEELFSRLAKSGIPTVGVWGNHDYFGNRLDPEKNRKHFETLGIPILTNEVYCVERGGVSQYFVCLDDSVKGVADPLSIRKQIPPDVKPLVVLCHNPNFVRRLPENYAELVLSGHSHGGQINPAPPPYHRELNWTRFSRTKHHMRYPQGWYKVNSNRLYTGRGVGVTKWPVRFGARPELAIFELKAIS